MRVHQLRKHRGEEGAVAVTVALLATVLVGVAAFTVDLGGAYLAKRDTANATDAASLAGAKELATVTGTCATVASNATATNAARSSGDTYLADNVTSATRTVFDVTCDATGKTIQVHYGADAKVDRALSGVFGGKGKYTVARDATAGVGVATDANGMRPYAICAADVPALQAGGVRQIDFPNALCGNQPGNWYSIDCPPTSSNSTQVLADNTRNGCDEDISIIDTSSATTDAQRISILQANCPKLQADPGCLTANTGNLPSNNITDAFDYLLGKDILLPVFFKGSVVGNGNNARYPVYAFVGVTVCGYHFQNKSGVVTTGNCSGAAFTGSGNYDAMLLKLTNVITSGSTKASTCTLGNIACDFGARSVRLIK